MSTHPYYDRPDVPTHWWNQHRAGLDAPVPLADGFDAVVSDHDDRPSGLSFARGPVGNAQVNVTVTRGDYPTHVAVFRGAVGRWARFSVGAAA